LIAAGSPNRCTHPEKSATAQSAAAVAEMGTASGHLVVLSIIVNVLAIFKPLTYYLCFTKPETEIL
jgi:hypothetical protein